MTFDFFMRAPEGVGFPIVHAQNSNPRCCTDVFLSFASEFWCQLCDKNFLCVEVERERCRTFKKGSNKGGRGDVLFYRGERESRAQLHQARQNEGLSYN